MVGAPLKQLVRSGARLVVIDPGVPNSLRLPTDTRDRDAHQTLERDIPAAHPPAQNIIAGSGARDRGAAVRPTPVR